MAKAQVNHSVKHAIIDKDNSRIFAAIAIATIVVVFSFFAIRALISQSLYHQRVISEKEQALATLRTNKRVADELKTTYVAFEDEAINVLGGNPSGQGPLDGDNAKIVLDALPSVYDYPALSSSLEKILLEGGYQIESIGGAEDPSLQVETQEAVVITSASEPVPIPYPFSVTTDPKSGLRLLETLEASIRPFAVQTLTIEGSGNNISMQIDLLTYYQPASGLQVSTKEVK